MELFRYRRLALGCASFLIFLFLSYYFNTFARVATVVLASAAALVAFILYFCKGTDVFLKAMIIVIPVSLFIILSMAVSLIAFDNNPLEKYEGKDVGSVTLTITEVQGYGEAISFYTGKISSIYGEKAERRVHVTYFGEKKYSSGDILRLSGRIDALSDDESQDGLQYGIEYRLTAFDARKVGKRATPIKDFLKSSNDFLDSMLSDIDDPDTRNIMSALFLGNKDKLSATVRRNFSRLGISHVLALSGMHISIVVAMVALALYPLKIRSIYKEIFLILTTAFFVGMTGFSPSAIRAGLMVCLAFLLSFAGRMLNTVTALFMSVTLICVFNPYSIFSLSLLLSFFALLGCISIMKYSGKIHIFRWVRGKTARFIVSTFLSSTFALLFTLPVSAIYFGRVAVLSPICNIFIAPFFTLLIYLTPLYLILGKVPFIGYGIQWICTKISTLLLLLGDKCAQRDGLLIPIINATQIVAVILICVFCLGFLLLGKRGALFALAGVGVGIAVFVTGTVALNIQRKNNVFVSAASVNGNDYVLIEDSNEVTLIDISDGNAYSCSPPYDLATELGYYEIDNLVITDYGSRTDITVQTLSEGLIVKRVTVPLPKDEVETDTYNFILSLGEKNSFDVELLGDEITCNKATVTLCPVTSVPNSVVAFTSFAVKYGSTSLVYLGSGSYSAVSDFGEKQSFEADVIIFGAKGPKYKVPFTYDTPYLDFCVFFGESKDFATGNFYFDKEIKYSGSEPVRFKLCP